MPDTYQEQIASVSPSTAGFSFDSATAQLPVFVLTANLEDALVDLLGSSEPRGDGRLRRTLPKAHPRFPWLYAERIAEVRGMGKPTFTPADPDLEAPALLHYADYPVYLLTVEFKPRPYAVVQDSLITKTIQSYRLEDGSSTPGAFTTEYTRFTDFEVEPNPELITAQQGQFKFRTSDNSSPGGVGDLATTFTGRPRILIPGQKFTMYWYQVPYSYVEDVGGYLTRFMGTVNQLAWLGYDPGTLLYIAPKVIKRYTPVVPELEYFTELGTFSTNKLCDLALSFQYTGKRATLAPTPVNANWVADGHNAQPFFPKRKFYYTSAHVQIPPGALTDEYPTFTSAPHQLLFTDPNA